MPSAAPGCGAKDEEVSITGTLIIQMIVFLILVGFTMKFVWPPIAAALDERAKKIADGLAAADKAKAELRSRQQARRGGAGQVAQRDRQRLADAERRAQAIVEEAKGRATKRAPRSSPPPRPKPSSRPSRPAKPCASRSPRWPSRAPSRSCARKSTPAFTPSCCDRLKTEL